MGGAPTPKWDPIGFDPHQQEASLFSPVLAAQHLGQRAAKLAFVGGNGGFLAPHCKSLHEVHPTTHGFVVKNKRVPVLGGVPLASF